MNTFYKKKIAYKSSIVYNKRTGEHHSCSPVLLLVSALNPSEQYFRIRDALLICNSFAFSSISRKSSLSIDIVMRSLSIIDTSTNMLSHFSDSSKFSRFALNFYLIYLRQKKANIHVLNNMQISRSNHIPGIVLPV